MVHPSFATQQRSRWMRPDASRWLRPDAAKFLKPGSDPADIYPALVQRSDRLRETRDRALNVAIEHERAVLDRLRCELAHIKSDLAWRRLLRVAQKYSPTQPRVPAGNTGGGRWTSGRGSGSGGSDFGLPAGLDDEDVSDGGQLDEIVVDGAAVNPGFDGLDDSFDDGSSESGYNSVLDRTPANRRTEIPDTRIVSDANPDTVRPGEQYAQLNKITDAAGDPYYAPGGHHEMAKAVYQNWDLKPETRRIFDNSTTGKLPNGTVRFDPDGVPYANRWGGLGNLHARYNDGVAELSENFLQKNNLKPENMTPQDALDLLAEIRGSNDPRIRDFNRAMRMLRRVFRFRVGRGE